MVLGGWKIGVGGWKMALGGYRMGLLAGSLHFSQVFWESGPETYMFPSRKPYILRVF